MEYIVVVHGTWNPPDATTAMWYQLDPSDSANFCGRLKERLEALGVGGAVWPSRGSVVDFSWSGDNDHGARQRAAASLAEMLHRIGRTDPDGRIHLIGHSHGGNVALKAVDLLTQRLAAEGTQLASGLLLGAANEPPRAVEDAVEQGFSDPGDARRGRARAWLEEFARDAYPLVAHDYVIDRWPRASALRRKWLLTSSVPVRDVVRQFASRWVAVHRPASVTFLGTPFYRKVWRRPNTAIRFLSRLPGTVVSITLMSAPLIYLSVMLYSAALAVLPGVTMVSWNALTWPTWLKALSMVVLIVAVALMSSEANTRDTNVYFDEVDLPAFNSPVPSRIPALVVSAGRLDEALVALSSEPFVFAYLVPQLRAMLAPPMRWSLPDDPAGRVTTSSTFGDVVLGFGLLALRNLAYAAVAPLWIPLRRWVVTPLLTEVLLKTVNASAFGLPPDELSTAQIVVGDRLNLPARFDETYREVGTMLLSAPPPLAAAARASTAAARYAFLAGDSRLDEKKQTSILWKRMRDAMPDLQRRYAATDRASLERDLALDVLALEERIREVAGGVNLNHSWYYTNADIIDLIAGFIANAARVPTGTIQASIQQ